MEEAFPHHAWIVQRCMHLYHHMERSSHRDEKNLELAANKGNGRAQRLFDCVV